MVKLSCVILSNTTDAVSYTMTYDCIASLVASVGPHISVETILVESNVDYDPNTFGYPEKVEVVQPKEKDFNFHRNLNFGLSFCTGEFIAFCNNDLLFHPQWFEAILKVSENNNFKAFSPVDPKEPKLPKVIRESSAYIEGYEIQKHFKGWCFVVRNSVFKTVRTFDERFNFYFADSDFIMTLYKYRLRHVAVMASKVEHIEKEPKQSYNKNMEELIQDLTIDRSKIPSYVLKEKRYWLLTSDRMVEGLIQYHRKWGSYKALKIKNYLARLSLNFGMPFMLRLLYLTK